MTGGVFYFPKVSITLVLGPAKKKHIALRGRFCHEKVRVRPSARNDLSNGMSCCPCTASTTEDIENFGAMMKVGGVVGEDVNSMHSTQLTWPKPDA